MEIKKMSKMQVSIDGGETWIDTDNVRVIYGNVGIDEDQDLLVNLTHEGIILDLMDESGDVQATAAMEISDLEEMTH